MVQVLLKFVVYPGIVFSALAIILYIGLNYSADESSRPKSSPGFNKVFLLIGFILFVGVLKKYWKHFAQKRRTANTDFADPKILPRYFAYSAIGLLLIATSVFAIIQYSLNVDSVFIFAAPIVAGIFIVAYMMIGARERVIRKRILVDPDFYKTMMAEGFIKVISAEPEDSVQRDR